MRRSSLFAVRSYWFLLGLPAGSFAIGATGVVGLRSVAGLAAGVTWGFLLLGICSCGLELFSWVIFDGVWSDYLH